MGAVVGGWGAVIVLFSRRLDPRHHRPPAGAEIGLLRAIGATPRQARRLIRAEALVVALLAAVGRRAGRVGRRARPARAAPRRRHGRVRRRVRRGPSRSGRPRWAVVLTSLVAAAITARRATRGPATARAAPTAGRGTGRMRWWRVTFGAAADRLRPGHGRRDHRRHRRRRGPLRRDADVRARARSWSASAWRVRARAAGWLASAPARGRSAGARAATWRRTTPRRRAHLLAGVLAPVIVLTAAAIGTLMLVGIDGRTLDKTLAGADDGDTITLLNNVVVGMIALFAAIMVVNAFVAVIGHRRSELAPAAAARRDTRQRSSGRSSRRRRSSRRSAWSSGLVASLATIVPFAIARDEGVGARRPALAAAAPRGRGRRR